MSPLPKPLFNDVLNTVQYRDKRSKVEESGVDDGQSKELERGRERERD